MAEGERGFRPDQEKKKEKPIRHETIVRMGGREVQQDAGGVREVKEGSRRVFLIAVADGHGFAGEQSSQVAVDLALAQPDAIRSDESAKQFFQAAHQDVLVAGQQELQRVSTEAGNPLGEVELKTDGNGGTTLTVVRIEGRTIRLAYVGDSEAGIVSADGTLISLTPPHHALQQAEYERLKKSGAKLTGHRLEATGMNAWMSISRSLGDTEFEPHISREPTIVETTIGEQDRFLLVASDGLWAKLDHQRRRQLEDALSKAKSPSMARRRIDALLSEWPQNDNVFLVIVELPKAV